MTTISANSTVGITLASPGYVNPIVVNPGVRLSGPANAIYGAGTAWTIQNAGTAAGPQNGIFLKAGGSIDNLNTGSISGYFAISASDLLTVSNAGRIAGNTVGGQGINLTGGGQVTNQGTASISGFAGIYGAILNVVNFGGILGSQSPGAGAEGVHLTGGIVDNRAGGTVSGYRGVLGAGRATVVNAGAIAGGTSINAAGVYFQIGGIVTNQSSGTISGMTGIGGGSGAVTVVNDGRIAGASAGISLASGGTVVNHAGGYIGGSVDAVIFRPGQQDRLIVSPGAVFAGTVDGGNTTGSATVTTLELTAGAVPGTLAGLGTAFVNFGSIVLDAGAAWTVTGGTAGLAGTIAGFAQGDTIEISGIASTGFTYANGVLTVNETSGFARLNLPGTFTTASFAVTNTAGGADVTLACFRAGTRIATTGGPVTVEALRPGVEVLTVLGGTPEPVVWIGHRTVDCARHIKPDSVWPVRIAAGAFGPGLPERALFLSPDHAVYQRGKLIPVKHLINGTSIVQIPMDRVTWYHVELPRHDAVLAEGLPTETYLDTGGRRDFENGGAAVRLYPDFSARTWEALGCAPRVVWGPDVAAVRRTLAKRASAARHETVRMAAGEDEPDLPPFRSAPAAGR